MAFPDVCHLCVFVVFLGVHMGQKSLEKHISAKVVRNIPLEKDRYYSLTSYCETLQSARYSLVLYYAIQGHWLSLKGALETQNLDNIFYKVSDCPGQLLRLQIHFRSLFCYHAVDFNVLPLSLLSSVFLDE